MATGGNEFLAFDNKAIPNSSGMFFGIVVSEWNWEITDKLYEKALSTLIKNGTSKTQITTINVPGALELVYGAKLLCEKDIFDAIIVIGCIIQGETRHFDFICQGVTQGIQQLNVRYNTPVIFCVLTDDNIEQSRERSGGKYGNKGKKCAIAAIKMAAL